MAEKILNTRIQSKIDTLENWNKSEIGLLKGEIAIATVAAEAGNNLTEPVYMIKVGEDGKKTFKDLDWNVYAKASDVLAICKDEDAFEEYVEELLSKSETLSQFADYLTNLKLADQEQEGYYVSSVSQEGGLISVTRQPLPDSIQGLSVEIDEYEGIKDCIILKDKSDNVISYVDASAFVKDGMLNKVEYNTDTGKLIFTWNSDSDIDDTTEISLGDIFVPYEGNGGINIDGNVISLDETTISALEKALTSVQDITSNGPSEDVPSGLIATKNEENNSYNIAIDDSITFIFNCGGAGVTV